MSRLTRRDFVAGVSALACIGDAAAQENGGLVLWFKKPAAQWTDALPIGNGRLGAMVFGGAKEERLQLNEDTLWSGAPRQWNNPEALKHLPEVRRLVLEEQDYVAADKVTKQMQGPFAEAYQPVGDLRIVMDHAEDVADYRRDLDLDSAVARTSYRVGEAHYEREAFVSAVDQVVVLRMTTTAPGGMNLTLGLGSPQRNAESSASAGLLRVTGKAPSHIVHTPKDPDDAVHYDAAEGKGMRFEAAARVIHEGGGVRPDGQRCDVESAKALTVMIAMGTGYRGCDRDPDLPAATIAAACAQRLDAAARKPYAALRTAHMDDHRKLFRRVSLELPKLGAAGMDTGERLAAFASKPDPDLLALYFQYGRYLLITSSRPGSQPANLQGIWNELVRAPWSSNWTANINIQMNYWPAETCNLADCHEPLFDLIADLSHNGARDGEDQLRLPRLGVASQYRSLAAIGAGGRLRPGVAHVGQLGDERSVALRAPVGALRVQRRQRVSAHQGVPADERRGGILPRLADRGQGRPPHHLPVGIDGERFHRARRPHRVHQRRLHHGHGAHRRVVLALRRSVAHSRRRQRLRGEAEGGSGAS